MTTLTAAPHRAEIGHITVPGTFPGETDTVHVIVERYRNPVVRIERRHDGRTGYGPVELNAAGLARILPLLARAAEIVAVA